MSLRESILREMGLGPIWKLRASADVEESQVQAAPVAPAVAEPPVSRPSMPEPASVAARPVESAPVAEAPGRPPVQSPRQVFQQATAPIAEAVSNSAVAGMDWAELRQTVVECKACGLCQRRRQAVFGVGDQNADWLFVGEGPGADEDEKGEPFVGQAGKLLDAMLAAIGLKRGEDVYIANTVKCRPPGNRTPEMPEMAACFPYLERQIELMRPRLIVALGRPAAQTLMGQEVKIGAVRGRLQSYRGIPLIVTYHPAYLLRNLADKALAWEDLCFARQTMTGLKKEG